MSPGSPAPNHSPINRDVVYLVDTDWAIDYLNGLSPVVERVGKLAEDGLGLSIASLAELYEGIYNSRDPAESEGNLDRFLGKVEILPVDKTVCQIFGRERGRLRAAGAMIGDLDILIGATALKHDLTLLTNNRRHFERMKGLDIISV